MYAICWAAHHVHNFIIWALFLGGPDFLSIFHALAVCDHLLSESKTCRETAKIVCGKLGLIKVTRSGRLKYIG